MSSPIISSTQSASGAVANPFAVLSGAGGNAANPAATSGANQDRFMTLLVAQMKNQDPLNPMDNAQVTSQIAQIDTVKGIAQLNQTVQKLLGNADAAQALQAAALLGRTALVDGKSIELGAAGALGGFDLTTPADDVRVTITSPAGQVVHQVSLGAMSGGIHSFAWDGKTDAGARAAPGAYTFSVSALSGGKSSAAASLAALPIEGVTPGAAGTAGTTLQLRGGGSVQMNQIRQLF